MKYKFDLAIYNRLTYGGMITTELPASSPDNRKWMGVIPLKERQFETRRQNYRYRVHQFEMKRSTYEHNKMNDYYQEEFLHEESYYVRSDEELLQLMETLGVDPRLFTYPWKCDYP